MTFIPPMSEATARRQVAAARGVLTRVERELEPWFYWSLAPPVLVKRHRDAERKLTAAVRRLQAIRSQRPQRHSGAWSA